MCDCTVDSYVGTGDFSLVLGKLHVCGDARVRSPVSPCMDWFSLLWHCQLHISFIREAPRYFSSTLAIETGKAACSEFLIFLSAACPYSSWLTSCPVSPVTVPASLVVYNCCSLDCDIDLMMIIFLIAMLLSV